MPWGRTSFPISQGRQQIDPPRPHRPVAPERGEARGAAEALRGGQVPPLPQTVGDQAQGATRLGRGSGGWMEDTGNRPADLSTGRRSNHAWRWWRPDNDTEPRFLVLSLDAIGMQSSDLDLKRKAPQDHKALQGNLFHYWGG